MLPGNTHATLLLMSTINKGSGRWIQTRTPWFLDGIQFSPLYFCSSETTFKDTEKTKIINPPDFIFITADPSDVLLGSGLQPEL